MAMNESRNYYRIEESAYWNPFLSSHPILTSGPTTSVTPPNRIKPPRDAQYTELRNEARAQREQLVAQTSKIQEARDALQSAYQGVLKQSDQIKDAIRELSQARAENQQLKAKIKELEGNSSNHSQDLEQKAREWTTQQTTSPPQ
jgi:chromosome segregation ATPase